MINLENLKYEIRLMWDGKSGGTINLKDSTLRLDTSVEFGGSGRYPCPDELFFSALGGCLLTTFLYFQRKLRLHLRDLQILIRGNVDFIGPEGYRVTGINALLQVKIAKGEDRKLRECVELAREYCHLTQALEKSIPIEISVEKNLKETAQNILYSGWALVKGFIPKFFAL